MAIMWKYSLAVNVLTTFLDLAYFTNDFLTTDNLTFNY